MTILRCYRKAAGFKTQKQLAEQMGVGRASIAKWELGKATPELMRIPRLATLLNVTEGEIIAAIEVTKDKSLREKEFEAAQAT